MRRSNIVGTPKQIARQRRRERRSILPSGFTYDQNIDTAQTQLRVRRKDGTNFVLISENELSNLITNQQTLQRRLNENQTAIDFVQSLL